MNFAECSPKRGRGSILRNRMADPEHVNEVVAGKYRVTRLLGQGGMGSVWEGVHASLGTRVAIKFIDKEHADSDEARSRFVNEARAAARLQTKHVVNVYDQGVTEDGRPYIVMEFLVGEPLDQRLSRVGKLAPDATAVILLQVCRALTKAHAAGIVHRDLKPENVFLVFDEEDSTEIAKVVDFGIAKFTDASMGVSSSTRTGSVLGTPYYMSPEQARGLRTVDTRSDLWSLGVIGFLCMVGRLPFTGEAVGDLLVKICTAPVPVPSQLNPELTPEIDAWFAKALAREPDERFQDAKDLAASLGEAVGIAPRSKMGSTLQELPSGPMNASPPPASTELSGSALGVRETQTVKAFTQSASAVPKKGVSGAVLAIGAVVALVTLGVVGVVAARALISPTAAASVSSEVAPAADPPASVPAAIDVPPDVPETATPLVSAAPDPLASAEPMPAAKPAPMPRPRPASKPARKPASKPTSKPAAKPASKPTPGTKPAPKPGSKPIDIGY